MPHRTGRGSMPLEFLPQLLEVLRPRVLVNPEDLAAARAQAGPSHARVSSDPSVPPGEFALGRLHGTSTLGCPECLQPIGSPADDCTSRWH